MRNKDGVLWDIGANIGVFSLLAAKYGVRVVSFEPLYSNYYVLCKNVEINSDISKLITVLPIALSDISMVDDLYIPTSDEGYSGVSFGEPIDQFEEFVKTTRYNKNLEYSSKSSILGMSGDEISKRTGEIGPMKEKAEREMIANAAAAAERSRHTAASAAFKHLAFTDPSRDSIGIFGSPGTPASTAPMDTPGTPAFPMGNSPFAGTQQQQAAMAAWQHVYPASPAGSAPSVPSISTEGFPTPSSFDSDATQPGGAGAPESYHLMADDMRGNGLTLFATH